MAGDRRPLVLLLVCLLLALVAGCGASGADPSDRKDPSVQNTFREGDKRGTGERRVELAPLAERFPALGEPESVEWYSGTLGDPDVPGPASYWIDARATLTTAGLARLMRDHPTAAAGTTPDVVTALREGLPTTSLRSSPDLDRAFSTHGFSTEVYLDPTSRLLVLSAKGQ